MKKPRLSRELKKNVNKYIGIAFLAFVPLNFTWSLWFTFKYSPEIPKLMMSASIINFLYCALGASLGFLFYKGILMDLLFDDALTEGAAPVPEPVAVAQPPAEAVPQPASPPAPTSIPAAGPGQQPLFTPVPGMLPQSSGPVPGVDETSVPSVDATPAPTNIPPAATPLPENIPPAATPAPRIIPPLATPPPMALPAMNTPMPGQLPKNPVAPVPEEDDEFGADNEFSEGIPENPEPKKDESGPFSGMGGPDVGGAGQK